MKQHGSTAVGMGSDTSAHLHCSCSIGPQRCGSLAVPALDCVCPVVQCYVAGGTRAFTEHGKEEIQALKQLKRDIVVLVDPDERGRELRAHIDDLLGGALHSFVPEEAAVAEAAVRDKEAGNRGIEHAAPEAIREALSSAVASFGAGRDEFSQAWAQSVGLTAAFDSPEHGSGARRRLLCARLGLGRCTGTQLLSALNRYFTREQVEDSLLELSMDTPSSQ